MHFWVMPYMSRIGRSANKPRLGLSILSGPRFAIGPDCQKSDFFASKAHISISLDPRVILETDLDSLSNFLSIAFFKNFIGPLVAEQSLKSPKQICHDFPGF